jgi:hypothetical protein
MGGLSARVYGVNATIIQACLAYAHRLFAGQQIHDRVVSAEAS